MRKSRKGNPPKTFGQCGSMWLGCILLRAEEILKANIFMRCTYSGWWGVHCVWFVPAPCTRCSCPPTGVFCTPTHISHGHKWESESQTQALNWLRGSWAAGELAVEGDTGALMTWELHPFSFLSPRTGPVPGITLSHGAWPFSPCNRVTAMVMAYVRRSDGLFLRESGKLSKTIQVCHGRGQAGPPWQATPWQSEPSREESVHGWTQDCCKEWKTKMNWYGVPP